MTDTPGRVRSIVDGRSLGKTESLEQTFVEAAQEAVRLAARGGVYVVLGPDSTPEFRARVEAVCPTVVDEAARGVALILTGTPGEWGGLDAA